HHLSFLDKSREEKTGEPKARTRDSVRRIVIAPDDAADGDAEREQPERQADRRQKPADREGGCNRSGRMSAGKRVQLNARDTEHLQIETPDRPGRFNPFALDRAR